MFYEACDRGGTTAPLSSGPGTTVYQCTPVDCPFPCPVPLVRSLPPFPLARPGLRRPAASYCVFLNDTLLSPTLHDPAAVELGTQTGVATREGAGSFEA